MNVIKVLLGWVFYFFIGLFCRNKKKWVISCKNGFLDNSKYFYLEVRDRLLSDHGVDLIWIAHSREEVLFIENNHQAKAFYKYSIPGIMTMIKSYVFIGSYGSCNDFPFFFLRGARKVELWHGVGIKDIDFYSLGLKSGLLKRFWVKYISPSFLLKPDIFLSTSERMNEYFKNSLFLNDDVIFMAEYPRCRVFFHNNVVNSCCDINIKFEDFKKIYLYVPTWRDSNENFLNEQGFDWSLLDEALCASDSLFLIKAHPRSKPLDLKYYRNIINLKNDVDIYSFIKNVDFLITDYSSIYYDFLLKKNGVCINFPFDIDAYLSKSRNLISDYKSSMPGVFIYKFDDLIYLVRNFPKYDEETKNKVENIKKDFWGDNNPDVFEFAENIIIKFNINSRP